MTLWRSIFSSMTVGDRILIGLLLAASLIGLAIGRHFKGPGDWIVVTVDSREKFRYSLLDDGEYGIRSSRGNLVLVIQDGEAYVKQSTCPAKICQKMGRIKHVGEIIVCVPNRIIIQVRGRSEGKWIDAVTQ